MVIVNEDLLSVTSGVIAHQVNALGIAGAGLARAIAKKYPQSIEAYCKRQPNFGECLLTYAVLDPVEQSPHLYIAHLVGQRGYGLVDRQTNYGALAHALGRLLDLIETNRLEHLPVCFPYGMGCGLGGGDWNIVREILGFYFPTGKIYRLTS